MSKFWNEYSNDIYMFLCILLFIFLLIMVSGFACWLLHIMFGI